MALVKCPECGREKVSDTAKSCPDCGFNVKEYFAKSNRQNSVEKISNKTKKNKKKIVLILIICVILAIVGYIIFSIVYEKYHKIDNIALLEKGLSQNEVHEILGVKPNTSEEKYVSKNNGSTTVYFPALQESYIINVAGEKNEFVVTYKDDELNSLFAFYEFSDDDKAQAFFDVVTDSFRDELGKPNKKHEDKVCIYKNDISISISNCYVSISLGDRLD